MLKYAMAACILALSAASGFAEERGVGDRDRSLFDRTHETLQRAEREGRVERPPAREDRGLINNSERGQMQRLETEERNNNRR